VAEVRERLSRPRQGVCADRSSPRYVLGQENQMGRPAVAPIDLQDKWTRDRVPARCPFDWPPGAPLTVVRLKDERSDFARVGCFVCGDSRRAGGDNRQDGASSQSLICSHRAPLRASPVRVCPKRRSTWPAPKLSNPTGCLSGVRMETNERHEAQSIARKSSQPLNSGVIDYHP
jgi:hypothetical protein